MMELNIPHDHDDNIPPPKLVYNAIQCPDGTVIESKHRHDFVQHTQKDGRTYFVDGGLEYTRRGFPDGEIPNDEFSFKELSIYE